MAKPKKLPIPNRPPVNKALAQANQLCAQGASLHQKGQLAQAVALYQQVLKLQPEHFDALHLIGVIAYQTNNYQAAIELIGKAIEINPNDPGAYNNLGNAFKDLRQWDAAMRNYDKAIALKPDYAGAYSNRGLVQKLLGQWDAAVHNYEKAIALEPGYAEAHLNLGLLNLLRGEYERGWPGFEWRWEAELKKAKRNFIEPLWLGNEPLDGKTILLYPEQGLGDTLQFCRYAKLVAECGAKVILEAQRPLIRLLKGLEGVHQVIASGDALPSFDYQCPLMSLPLAFKTRLETIPADIPYIYADPEKVAYWRNKLGAKIKPRVGLVWNGGVRQDQPQLWAVNERRNILLSQIAKLNLADALFYSLQKGEPAETELLQKKQILWPENNFFNFANELNDFSDTAALIENLDLVISVDTSTAHLAGAMGKPVWILNRFDTCWRWLLDRTDSPWYRTVTLYRQKQMGDWEDVLERVKTDLANFISH